MDNWFSHTLTGVLGILAGAVPGFILRIRQQTFAEWQAMVAGQRARIDVLEKQVEAQGRRIEELHVEHARCLAVQAELREKIASLEFRSN